MHATKNVSARARVTSRSPAPRNATNTVPSSSGGNSGAGVTAKPVFLELFAGHATLSAAVRDEGLGIGTPIEIRRGPHHDLGNRRLQRFVKDQIRRRKIWALHLATPCTVWSVARRTGTSSTNWGTSLGVFTRSVIRLCRKYGVLFTLENPLSSGLFRWGPIRRELKQAGAYFIRYDNCAYGANYLKPTLIATNILEMKQLSRLCPGNHYHEHLSGKVKVESESGKHTWAWKTTLAGLYPPRLCRTYARVLKSVSPPGALHASDLGRWEADMARAAKKPVPAEPWEPRCPRTFCSPWAGAVGCWGGERRWVGPRRGRDRGRHVSCRCVPC